MSEKWVVLHQMDSQDEPEFIAVIDAPEDGPIYIDELAAELRMKPDVDVPSMAPGDTLKIMDMESYEFHKNRGEVAGEPSNATTKRE